MHRNSIFQSEEMTAAEGQHLTMLAVQALGAMRNERDFDLLWEEVTKLSTDLEIGEATLPRKRRAPARFETGSRDTYHEFETPKALYSRMYFEAVDTAVQCIQKRFEQTDWGIYRNIQVRSGVYTY